MTREEEILSKAKKYYSDSINCHNAFLHGVKYREELKECLYFESKNK